METGRNDPCPCGSGKKYKKCCGDKAVTQAQSTTSANNLFIALGYHRLGNLAQAEALYREALLEQPKNHAALNLLGMLAGQTGRLDEAVHLINKAIKLNPSVPEYYNNLGNVLRLQKKFDEAIVHLKHAITLKPKQAELHASLGNVYRDEGRLDEAIAAFSYAVAIHPGFAQAYNNLGLALRDKGELAKACESFERALVLQPNLAEVRLNLGTTLEAQDKRTEAIGCYEQALHLKPDYAQAHLCLAAASSEQGRMDVAATHYEAAMKLQPDNEEVRHMLDALHHTTTPRAPATYVKNLFDKYAGGFDEHLVEKLDYRIPELLYAVIADMLKASAALDVLDLGCGTGLFGAQVKPSSRRLVGIDLSPRMITQARARAIYDELVEGDLMDYLKKAPDENFDLIVATDVFVYLGDLAQVFAHSQRVLRSGGLFAFSVEGAEHTPGDFVLDISGRFQHSRSYIAQLAQQYGFSEAHSAPAVIRKHDDKPANGYIYIFQKM
jgi:predicted TPR repeat methyltransferase